MTQWEKIVQYQLVEKAWVCYQEQDFPIQVRMLQTKRFYPKWLEISINNVYDTAANIDCSFEPQVEQFKTNFFRELNAAIEQKISKARATQNALSIVQTLDLQTRIKDLERRFSNNASGFFMVVKTCLEAEKNLISGMDREMSLAVQPQLIPVQPPVLPSLLQQSKFSVEAEFSSLSTLHQEIVHDTNYLQSLEYFTSSQNQDPLSSMESIIRRDQVNSRLNQNLQNFAAQSQIIFQRLSVQVNEISKWLKSWMVDQRRVLNGDTPRVDLEELSLLANTVTKGLLNLYQIIKLYSANGAMNDRLAEIQVWIGHCVRTLITETFIIHEQPKQILLMKSILNKNSSKKSVKVRLLVGPALQNFGVTPVEASLIERPEAINASKDLNYVPKIAMKLQNNIRDIDPHKYIADFKEIKMPKKREDSSTTAEKGSKQKNPTGNKAKQVPTPQRKYYFHFRIKLSCSDLDIPDLSCSTTSVPVIVDTHTEKKNDSWATILWDNISAELDQNPFPEDLKIDGSKLIDVFSKIFQKDTGRELSVRNKEFLLKKIMSCSDVPTEKVSWEMFFHHPLQNCLRPEKLVGTQNESPDNDDESDLESITSKSSKPVKVKHVTFHSWIYEIKQMCTPCTQNKTGIPKFWKDGMIEGFIDRNTLHEELQKKKGRFALYFSDALLGGLTVAWYNLEMKKLQRLSPFTPNTFVENNELERRLHDQTQLQNLYPGDQPKNIAFPFDADRMTVMQRKLANGGYTPHCSKLQQMNPLS